MRIEADPGRPGRHAEAERLAAALGRRLAAATPLQVLEAALDRRLAGEVAIVSSFGAESAVLLHMAASIDRSVPVLFLDTGWLFAETLAYRDRLAERLGLTDIRSITPDPADLRTGDAGRDLWVRDPDACCRLRKVLPLERALEGLDGWINGRKRFHGDARAALPVVEADGARLKFNPLAGMTAEEIRTCFARHDLPRHPLQAQGFASIGCMPCTSRVRPGEPARAGRWRGRAKTECGIHGSGSLPAMPLVRNGRRAEDPYIPVEDAAGIPRQGAILLPAARFLAEAEALAARSDPVGVIWPNDRPVEELAPHLDRLALIALVFPVFRDGRAYSQARRLREGLGWRGELRATGDVLRDQFLFMTRAGFDAFAVKKEADADAFAAAVARYPVVYQPAGDRRPTALRHRLAALQAPAAAE